MAGTQHQLFYYIEPLTCGYMFELVWRCPALHIPVPEFFRDFPAWIKVSVLRPGLAPPTRPPIFTVSRHTAASLLLLQGVHIRVVMEILGHSSISITADTYSHVLPALTQHAASEMDIALSSSSDEDSQKSASS